MESALILKKQFIGTLPISKEELAFFEEILQEAKAAPAVLKEALEIIESYKKSD